MKPQFFDIIIIGAGLSGIGTAARLAREHPSRSIAILESRDTLGGTWSLFRYPGTRCDSDMQTLGFDFRPWSSPRSVVEAPEILRYLTETASEYGLERHIRYGHRVRSVDWSDATGRWSVTGTHGIPGASTAEGAAADAGEEFTLECAFLISCTGYYRYAAGYTPDWPSLPRFRGRVVHPQFWPEDAELAGKDIVVIGSGATAVTLAPALAAAGARVRLLQRSPSYIAILPAVDPWARWATALLPNRLAGTLIRQKNILRGAAIFRVSRVLPGITRRVLMRLVAAKLPRDYDVKRHFGPNYPPWDQRLCLDADGALCAAISAGSVTMVTDTIARFESDRIILNSGTELPADMIVTATGLDLEPVGGITLMLNGVAQTLDQHVVYRGSMLSDVPNFVFALGYVNASWTLKITLVGNLISRLLRHLDRGALRQVTPRYRGNKIGLTPMVNLTSGYIRRRITEFPIQTRRGPWHVEQSYFADTRSLGASFNTADLEFLPISAPYPREQAAGIRG